MKSLRWIVGAVLLTLAASAQAAEVIGRTLVAVGDVFAVRAAREVRLQAGSPIEVGDLVRTGAASNAQIRLTDESIVALRPGTEFHFSEYRYTGREDGSERAFFRLVRGGLRTITGIVGRTNHQNYRVNTVVATIGIRGTHYALALCQRDCRDRDGSLARDGLYGNATGASFGTNQVTTENKTPQQVFGINEPFHVPDFDSRAERLPEPPFFLSDRLAGRDRNKDKGAGKEGTGRAEQGVGGDGRTDTAVPPPIVVVTPPPPPAQLLAGAVPTIAGVGALFDSLGFPGETGDGGGFFAPSNVTLSGTGISTVLLGFTLPAGFAAEAGGGGFASAGSSSGTIFNDTQLNSLNANWGRWTGGSLTELDATPSPIPVLPTNQFHYLFGPLSPPGVVAAKSGSFLMSLVQGTMPTNNVASDLGSGSFSAPGMNVDFTTRMVSASGFGFGFTTQTWTFGGISTPIQFAAGKGAFIEAGTTGSCSGTTCSGPANLGMTGIFMGAKGDHLGVGFNAVTISGTPAHASTAKIFSCSSLNC